MIDLWIKALLRFPRNIGRAQEYLASKRSRVCRSATEAPIVLDLRTPQLLFDSGRHLACLAYNARLAGSATLLRCSRLLLAEISRKQFGQEFLSDPDVTWLPPETAIPPNALLLYDGDTTLTDAARSMRLMVGRDILGKTTVMPYPMHPATLSFLNQIDLPSLRETSRNIKVFFAGTQAPRYGRPRVTQGFGVQDRIALLSTVRQHRHDRVVASPENITSDNAIVLSDSRTDAIEPADWLPTLAKADFFLCCPGAAQPLCHNVIESMSVGTIPLIEYGNRLTPPLTDEVNAVCFRGSGGLKEALDRIDQLPPEQIATMRQNVVTYYESHLRGDRFLAELRDGYPRSGIICMPFNDKNFFRGKFAANRAA